VQQLSLLDPQSVNPGPPGAQLGALGEPPEELPPGDPLEALLEMPDEPFVGPLLRVDTLVFPESPLGPSDAPASPP
jgi:hypothetical protein